MKINDQENNNHQIPIGPASLLSLLVGCGAFWFAWFQYSDLADQSQLDWYVWIRPVLLLLVGVFCLTASTLFAAGRPVAWTVFMSGLSLIPLMLFSNLIVLIFRVIQNIFQGNTDPFLSHLSTSPLKVILNIVVVIFVLSLIQVIKKRENND